MLSEAGFDEFDGIGIVRVDAPIHDLRWRDGRGLVRRQQLSRTCVGSDPRR